MGKSVFKFMIYGARIYREIRVELLINVLDEGGHDSLVPVSFLVSREPRMQTVIDEESPRFLTRVQRSNRQTLFYAVLAAFVVRLIVVAFVYQSFLVPEREHWLFGFEIGKIAQSIVQGHGFGNLYYGGPTGPTAAIAPVLPYIMAGVFAAFGIYTKAAALVVLGLNSLFSALTCIPIFFIAKKSFELRIAKWATWGWAFFPYAIYFSADSMWDHALVTLLLSCIFWAALLLPDSSRRWSWAGFGLLCGFSALANPIVLGVVPFLVAWACYRLRVRGCAWLQPSITAALVICGVIAPWLVRNYRIFGRPVFLKDNLPLELYVGNVGRGLYWWDASLHPSGNSVELSEYRQIGEQAYIAKKWVAARDFIEDHPAAFLWRSIRRFVYLWTGYWSFNPKYLQEESFDVEDIPFRTALTIVMLIGIWKVRRGDANLAMPYFVMLIVFPLAYYVTHPEIAYRTPIDPEILILACCGMLKRKAETGDGAGSDDEVRAGDKGLVPEPELRT